MNDARPGTDNGHGDTPPVARTGAVVACSPSATRKGLHARASARFVQTVEKFDASVRVMRAARSSAAPRSWGLMMLAASPGTSITVEATARKQPKSSRLDGTYRVGLREQD